MAILVSEGQIRSVTPAPQWRSSGGGVTLSNRYMDYATIYRTQPHVRTAVDFIARNIAQLGLHVYQRLGETDRIRLRDHPLAQLFGSGVDRMGHRLGPNDYTTRHRLIYSAMADRGIYGASFWLKFKPETLTGMPMRLLRVPPVLMTVQGNLFPTGYEVKMYPKPMTLRPDQVVHFRNYSPLDNVSAVSPIESLRLILDEDLSSVERRRDLWNNAGRQPIIIRRPKTAGDWSQPVATRFSELFTEAIRDSNSKTTPLLEDDMDIITLSFNAEQSQYVEARKLTREEVATAYNIPLAMFGIAGAPATYSSVESYHTSLYTDTLGPWLDDLEEDIELQLFGDFAGLENAYVEFNISQKMAGSFAQQVEVLSKSIGRPWMTADEGRGRLNLPAKGGMADELAVPVNIDPSGRGASVPTAPAATGLIP